ncbi:hypothetical protein, partial [Micromonospora sp. CPCC 205561]|uniref:hypothetical protein n=1 Tax=Micromonospora sp. CPCC 205561 TaxID=3122407 RepID=UPI002FF040EC
ADDGGRVVAPAEPGRPAAAVPVRGTGPAARESPEGHAVTFATNAATSAPLPGGLLHGRVSLVLGERARHRAPGTPGTSARILDAPPRHRPAP